MPKYGYLAWNVTFESGNITARTYGDVRSCDDNTNNKVVLQEVIRVTTGPPSKLLVSWSAKQNWTNLAKSSNGIQEEHVLLLRVDIVDSSDRIVPLPNEYPILVTFTITSNNGILLGTGNGNPSDLTNDKSPNRNAYHGSVLGLIQATIDVEIGMINKRDSDDCGVGSYENGLIEIVVSSEGFEDVVIQLPIHIDRYQQPSL
jgi:Glycoside hydrolase family 2 C-terminal domain 5